MVNIVHKMAQELQIPMPDKLPQSVQDVCNVFNEQFSKTANDLLYRAEALEDRAKQLRAMSTRIRDAADTVPTSLRRWVEEEMRCREASATLSAVNPDPDFT